jgi:hypothetical protein
VSGLNEDAPSGSRVKVVDRRWFTDDGTPRGEVGRGLDTERRGASGRGEPEAGHAREEAISTSSVFLDLVSGLAQQAELLLVGASGFPKQPEHARRIIEYLSVLEVKTRNNLSPEEAKILSTAVFRLQSLLIPKAR